MGRVLDTRDDALRRYHNHPYHHPEDTQMEDDGELLIPELPQLVIDAREPDVPASVRTSPKVPEPEPSSALRLSNLERVLRGDLSDVADGDRPAFQVPYPPMNTQTIVFQVAGRSRYASPIDVSKFRTRAQLAVKIVQEVAGFLDTLKASGNPLMQEGKEVTLRDLWIPAIKTSTTTGALQPVLALRRDQ
ncbi:hypothetical protein C8Q76DRAFT_747690 [Earliella scabrosa]|nr:hypothetical protein C8Q76DRAFT_747690 [Earliella scabrosa]